MSNAGMMIGGPRAGQFIDGGDRSVLEMLEATVLSPASYNDPISAVMSEVKRHFYVWRPMRIGKDELWFWVHDPLAREGDHVIFREIISGYRPSWVRQ
jgi:hypothetical protein